MANHPARKTNGKEIYVVVTTAHRGVFGGFASDTNSKTIRLRQARNCLYWPSTVGGFVGLSVTGPNAQTKIGPAAPFQTLHDVTSVLECTPEAEKAWVNANWKF